MHHGKNQKKKKKNNARTFSKNSTVQTREYQNLQAKKRVKKALQQKKIKPELSNTLEKPLAAKSLVFLKTFHWID